MIHIYIYDYITRRIYKYFELFVFSIFCILWQACHRYLKQKKMKYIPFEDYICLWVFKMTFFFSN